MLHCFRVASYIPLHVFQHSQSRMNHSPHSIVLSHGKSCGQDRVCSDLMLAPSPKANAVNPSDDPPGPHEQKSIHHAHHSTMFLASHSFRPFGSHQSSRVPQSSDDGDRVIILPTQSQSIPWTTMTPTHSSIRKPLSGSYTFLPTPPPTNPRSAPLSRALATRNVLSPSTRNQRPKSVTLSHVILPREQAPIPTSSRSLKPKYIRNVLPYRHAPRPSITSAAFSNIRSAFSLSVVLPLLLSYSDTITRIQLRSTCRLYRLAFHNYTCSRMGLDDIRLDPLAADPSRAVHVKDWQARFPSGALRVWLNLRLVEVWREAEAAELKVPLIRERQASYFFLARLPCIPQDEWTVERYRVGVEGRARARLQRHEMRFSAGIDHEIFGRIEKETWHVVKGPAWYTVEDLVRILMRHYEAWSLRGREDGSKEGGDHAEESWKRTIVLRWDESHDGYIFDASKMQGWYYP